MAAQGCHSATLGSTEMDPDIAWIAEVCDHFAEHMRGAGERADGRTDEEGAMGSTKGDSISAGYVDVETNMYPFARRAEPSQISDTWCLGIERHQVHWACELTSDSRLFLGWLGHSTAVHTSDVLFATSWNLLHARCPFIDGCSRGATVDHVKAMTSAKSTQERKTKKTRTETAEVPHVTCPGCAGKFREDTFRRHWRYHCGQSPERETRQPLVCDVCRRMWKPGDDPLRDFSTDHSLRRHVVGQHTEEDWHVMQRKRGKKTRRSHMN
ncbi:predicted protein [Postia placenta Mad-698-R]|uniref:Uncharacterized protein n=1 Tax=Postia placenta MAD-698-R-SB12 TaxID=670580 RepID=A0A1X6N3K0_9APHY|nr:hypothetical protein POSPLADRAFT_1139038 [Postia placenta MAD-698-R-SB12]EED85897.1 predicted protein [Postia placenta Mad-698-R]OSX63194.1 hypothetical protein POSPLADRAFT_1139038 [Postia placenta MAD-698-R-SB12]